MKTFRKPNEQLKSNYGYSLKYFVIIFTDFRPAPSSPNEHIYGNTDNSVGGEHSATPFQYNNAPDNKNTITELNR